MPTTLSETARFGTSGVVVPASGDPRTAVSVATPIQELTDRTLFARGALWGTLELAGGLTVAPGGSSTVFEVKVGPCLAVTLRDASNIWRPYFWATEQTLTLAHAAGAPGALSADTWYYVYVYSDGTTTPAFQISTDPPTESGAPSVCTGYKRGQVANYRYIGAFRTNGSAAPLPQRTVRGRTVYRDQAATLHTGITTANIGTWSNGLSLAARVPPHAVLALVRLAAGRGTNGNVQTSIRTSGDTTEALYLNADVGALVETQGVVEMINADVAVSTASGTTAAVGVTGYQE